MNRLAADIGTTTIELCLIDDITGKILDTGILLNPQRIYGSDVISRAKNASKADLAGKMCSMIRDSIQQYVTDNWSVDWRELSLIVLSGNSLMMHLFFNLDTTGFLTAPYIVNNLIIDNCIWDGVKTVAMPAVSAFVGGDIISGLYSLSVNSLRYDKAVFSDLGTNGEIALIIDDKLIATSVACGPAFEGGNISIGSPAIAGAIDKGHITNGFCRIETIDNIIPPRGLCGSGLIEAVFELHKGNIIDDNGSFTKEQYRKNGYDLFVLNQSLRMTITQDDIRALQTAKAAVSAGIEVLISDSGLSQEDIVSLFVAGSFGSNLDIKKASGIGLIPKALEDKVVVLGNTSLNGAVRLCLNPDDYGSLCRMSENASSVSLADSDAFKSSYIKNINL